MSIVIKTGYLQAKDENGDYIVNNTVAEKTIAKQIKEIETAGSSQIAAVQQKGAETRASIPDDYTTLNDSIEDVQSVVRSYNNLIVNANINANGEIIFASAYDLYIFATPSNGLIDSIKTPDGIAVYAFFTDKPELGSVSYNASRITSASTEVNSVDVPEGCGYIAIRQAHNNVASISPQNAIESVESWSKRFGEDFYTNGSYYYNPVKDSFKSDIVDTAVSYLVHSVNNTQISGSPNTEAPLFYGLYGNVSWRYLLRKDDADLFQYKVYNKYNGIEYPVYISHCSPFASSVMSCVKYEESPWCYQYQTPDNYGVEKKWSYAQEKGTYIEKPYTYSWPIGYLEGSTIAYAMAATGEGLVSIAKKTDGKYTFDRHMIDMLETGDWIHAIGISNNLYAGHMHSMVYIKTLDEIRTSVAKYGCQLINWYGKDIYDGKYGYVIEVTNNNADGTDQIRVTDLEYYANKTNAPEIAASYSKSTKNNSTKALRICNNFGDLWFIHQPYSALCVNGEDLYLEVLPSKSLVYYQWQKSSDNGTTWSDIADATESYYSRSNPVAGDQYRCRVTDRNIGKTIYSDPRTVYILTVSNPDPAPNSGSYVCTISIGGDSGALATGEWQYTSDIKNAFVKTLAGDGNTLRTVVNADRDGWAYRFKVTMPDGSVYYTKAVKFYYNV